MSESEKSTRIFACKRAFTITGRSNNETADVPVLQKFSNEFGAACETPVHYIGWPFAAAAAFFDIRSHFFSFWRKIQQEAFSDCSINAYRSTLIANLIPIYRANVSDLMFNGAQIVSVLDHFRNTIAVFQVIQTRFNRQID